MSPLRLNIAQPCAQDWNAMTGSEKRRHCASCDKHVVALAEMMPEDALALVRNAKPHSLCLRIEHDDAGAVMFRQTVAPSNPMPLLVLTVGVSMLLPACEDKTVAIQSVDHVETTADSTSTTQTAKPPIAPEPVKEKEPHAAAQTASSANAQGTPKADVRPEKSLNRPTTRITTGCVCAVGDKLCDCL